MFIKKKVKHLYSYHLERDTDKICCISLQALSCPRNTHMYIYYKKGFILYIHIYNLLFLNLLDIFHVDMFIDHYH